MKFSQQFIRPGLFPWIEKLCRGCISKFCNSRAAKAPVKKIRHHQQALRLPQNAGLMLLCRQQLEKRIEWKELQAGSRENFCSWHPFESCLHHAACASVTIMKWLAKNLVLFGEQHVIYAPGIHADRSDAFTISLRGQSEALLNLRPNP